MNTATEIDKEIGPNKLALGHHRDDIIETFLLNPLFNPKLETALLKSLINSKEPAAMRPLYLGKEKEIDTYVNDRNFPMNPCNLCGSQPKLQRPLIKKMIKEWGVAHPDRSAVIFNPLKNSSPSPLLDKNLYDFINLKN